MKTKKLNLLQIIIKNNINIEYTFGVFFIHFEVLIDI